MSKSILEQRESGSYVGTGAAVEVKLGYKPSLVLAYNETDGDVLWICFEGMADGKSLQVDTAVSFLSANGITLRNYGFTAGTSCSESGKTMRFLVFQ